MCNINRTTRSNTRIGIVARFHLINVPLYMVQWYQPLQRDGYQCRLKDFSPKPVLGKSSIPDIIQTPKKSNVSSNTSSNLLPKQILSRRQVLTSKDNDAPSKLSGMDEDISSESSGFSGSATKPKIQLHSFTLFCRIKVPSCLIPCNRTCLF
jgi:hypothetical protein